MSDAFKDAITEAMVSVWDRRPHQFQADMIKHIIKMQCDDCSPQACLLVQGTGGGKSAVCQAIGSIDAGVTLIIENTLSLSSDQVSKISTANTSNGDAEACQLDNLKTATLRNELSKCLRSLTSETNTAIHIFSSPEELQKVSWIGMLICLINKNMLCLACIDEAHLFVMLGIAFRLSFLGLQRALFKHLVNCKHNNNEPDEAPAHLKVLILRMTATFDEALLKLLQDMLQTRFPPAKFFWCGELRMRR